jgi:threonylcarbamoyladenosine tRNA methylthiotransferase MtaB
MKIFIDIVGCRLNQSEAEGFANVLRALGHQIVSEPAEADLAIINTCAVTGKAAADSRKKLRGAQRAGVARVIATGCWATLYPQEALELADGIEVVVNQDKENLVASVLSLPPDMVDRLSLSREPLPGDRARTRAFIRVQEGCDHHCTYCLTRVARGKSRSRRLDNIRRDISAALDGGAKEIVLTGVQLGGWGKDFENSESMADLLAGILALDGFDRLRLSSIEPWDLDPSLMAFWEDERLCHHLHIPLQSGNDCTLKSMGRPINTQQYASLLDAIRKAVPDIAITTDVIAGFPGETEEDFDSTKAFIEKMAFAGGHVFTFSPRMGTPAYHMKDKVHPQVAKARNAEMRNILSITGRSYRKQFVGQTLSVLWESCHDLGAGCWGCSGLTDTYIRVLTEADLDLWNEISQVAIDDHHPRRGALVGQIMRS